MNRHCPFSLSVGVKLDLRSIWSKEICWQPLNIVFFLSFCFVLVYMIRIWVGGLHRLKCWGWGKAPLLFSHIWVTGLIALTRLVLLSTLQRKALVFWLLACLYPSSSAPSPSLLALRSCFCALTLSLLTYLLLLPRDAAVLAWGTNL